MNYPDLSRKVQEHVQQVFEYKKDKSLFYHNLAHTQNVVKAATRIGKHYQLNEKDLFTVTTAAWFHDIGYLEDYDHHEIKGVEAATEFLRKQGVPEEITQAVSNCILATRMPQSAKTNLEEIVCDSDMFQLGSDEFSENNKLLRKEVEIKKGIPVNKDEWRRNTILFLESHRYYTEYCQYLLNPKKKEAIERLKNKVKEKAEPALPPQAIASHPQPQPQPDTTAPRKREKSDRPERGIETMFRITSGNNQRLSDMADNKAQIMITVNSIILSAIISLLLRKLEENAFLKWPTFLMLATSVLTIIFAILATRPNLPPGTFTQQDIDDKKVNLLFFGNFFRMNLDDYTAGMLQVMEDRNFLYRTLIKDVYSQGVVLGRKYKLLRISYNIFMYGLVASVLAFVVATAAA
jgi:predicted metal-dependent HD superfamily phosphohydrolase